MWKVLYFTIHTKRLFSKAIIWKVTGVLDKVCTRQFIFQCAPKREWRFEKGWPDLSIRKLLTRSNSYSFGHVQNEPRPISNMNHDLLTTQPVCFWVHLRLKKMVAACMIEISNFWLSSREAKIDIDCLLNYIMNCI